jgi:catechol 2,3-dioxygenase-like lactoylglutathione lyase family enzyme
MAHHSRIAGLSIDCRTDDLEAAARFWAAALGCDIRTGDEPGPYLDLGASSTPLTLEVQQVTHDSRVHLDIATDDVAAEVARLEALGARRHADIHDWVVMEAPTGQRFCVIPARADGFAGTANRWETRP